MKLQLNDKTYIVHDVLRSGAAKRLMLRVPKNIATDIVANYSPDSAMLGNESLSAYQRISSISDRGTHVIIALEKTS